MATTYNYPQNGNFVATAYLTGKYTNRKTVGRWRRSELFLGVRESGRTTTGMRGTFGGRRRRERHQKAEDDDCFFVDDVRKQERMMEIAKNIQKHTGHSARPDPFHNENCSVILFRMDALSPIYSSMKETYTAKIA